MKTEAGSDTFVSSVAGSTGFSASGYQVNPGLADRNLALSKEAQKYDQYQFEELTFRFVRSRAITTTPGMVGLALDPNPNSSDPSALNRFNAYEIRKMDSVYTEILLRVPKEALAGWRYIRSGPLGSDLSLYDVGRLIVATQDEDDTSKIGFVEVHYRVKFKHYHLEPATPTPHGVSLYNLSSSQTMTNNTYEVIEFDEAVVDGVAVTPSSGVFTLPTGQYLIQTELVLRNNTDEDSAGIAKIRKNGAELTPPVTANSVSNGPANQCHNLVLTAYVVSDGTDTIDVQGYITGLAGTLVALGDNCRITIRALT
jgi:hypothetical protein